MISYLAALGRNDLRPTPGWLRVVQVGTLLGVLAGIVMFRAWRLLWCPFVAFPVLFFCERLKQVYWSGLDPFIWKASDREHFCTVVAWNVLTVILDWTITILSATLVLLAFEWLSSGVSAPACYRWLLLWCCLYPLRLYVKKGLRLWDDPVCVIRGCIPFACALVSFVLPVAPVWYAVASAVVAVLVIPPSMWVRMPKIRQDYEVCLKETKAGIVHDYSRQRSWFPRPGVIYEPQLSGYEAYSRSTFDEMRPFMTILRLNACGFFISLLFLVSGLSGVIWMGRPMLILLVPCLILTGLFFGFMTSEVDRTIRGDMSPLRGVFTLVPMLSVGLLTLYFGAYDPMSLVVLGMLLSASWFFFGGFMVRATSHGVFDTVEFILMLAATGCVVLARTRGCAWSDSLVPVLFFAFLLPHIRRHFPRTDLPDADPSASDTPLSGKDKVLDEKLERRRRKRERQMAAFKRSQWRRN